MTVTTRRLIAPLIVAIFAFCTVGAQAQGAFPAPLPNGASAPASTSVPVRGAIGTPNDPAFPPVRGAVSPRSDPAFPPVNGAPSASLGAPSAFPSNGAAPIAGGGGGGGGGFSQAPVGQQAGPPGSDECMKGFLPLRQEAEKRGNLIKAASARHAPPDEACKLIGHYSQAEGKMLKYIESHQQKCGIPTSVADQMRTGHKGTESMLQKVCAVAQQGPQQRGPAGPSLSDVLGSSATLPEATASKKGGSTFDTLNGNVLAR